MEQQKPILIQLIYFWLYSQESHTTPCPVQIVLSNKTYCARRENLVARLGLECPFLAEYGPGVVNLNVSYRGKRFSKSFNQVLETTQVGLLE